MQRLLIALVILLLFTGNAEAYIDPGAGSLMLQALLGGFAALMAAGAAYWRRIRSFMSRDGAPPPTNEEKSE